MFSQINRKVTRYINRKYPNWDITIALRYLPIISDLKKSFSGRITVLDVGSGEFGLATYSRGLFAVTGTDVDFGNKKGNFKIVKASAESLPFADNSFTAVVSVDMLEHLPSQIREKAVSEMVRVAKDGVYLSFPRGRLSGIIDKFLSGYYKFTHKENFPFLEEHQRNGLPQEERIESFIKNFCRKNSKKPQIVKKGNTNSFLWLGLLLLGFSEVKILTSIYHKLLLVLPFLNIMHFWPTYRVSYFVKFQEK